MAARGGFKSKFGFIAAAAGSAVGLGNIWKFPFEVGEGGGAAFVGMYLLFCFLLCFPILVAEIAIGRKTQRNPVGAFDALKQPRWKIVGKLGVLAGVLILSFYNVVAGWAFGYFIELLNGNFSIGQQFGDFIVDVIKVGGYGLLFMLATAFIVSRGVSDGIEQASKILMPTLIVLILGLAVYALTLDHAIEGLKFYLVPDFSKITFEVVYNALGQAFFSLSLGMGALITYGSYVGKQDNIITSAILITLADVGIAFIAGLMMFPFVAYLSGGTMEGVQGGAGLIFVTLPGVFETLGPVLGIVVGSIFFLLLSFAALTSTVSLLEVPVAYVVDQENIPRRYAVWGMAALVFVLGLPSLVSNGYSAFFTEFITYFGSEKPNTFMDLVEHLASDTFLPLGGFLISIFTAYVWRKERLDLEVSTGFLDYPNTLVSRYIGFALRYICPVVLGGIFIFTVLDRFFGVKVFGG
ncbi:MAG: sodium-dependent transporter [Bernardetiaceae bacterium]